MPEIGRINHLLLLFLLLLAGAFAQYRPAFADYYKYRDSKGTICITNDLKAVPHKYRSTMKVIREENHPGMNTGQAQTLPVPIQLPSSTVRETLSARPTHPPSRLDQFVASFPWATPFITIGSVIVTFLFIIKLRAIVSSPQLARLISLVLFLGVFVFVFKIYTDHLAASYNTIKDHLP